jgi:putative Mg2+ transporter-C (MgtC) family protein
MIPGLAPLAILAVGACPDAALATAYHGWRNSRRHPGSGAARATFVTGLRFAYPLKVRQMPWLDALRTATPETAIAFRLLLAAALGAVIGLEREFKARPAGLRTHMLVALAAAVFTLITLELLQETRSVQEPGRADPIRVIEAVTAGVAFLAAGAIIQARGQVQGITTGAAMWLAGAVGVACGGGYYTIAMMATVLAMLILTVLAYIERRIEGSQDTAARTEQPPRNRQR